MAGDWIKMRGSLLTNPKVLAMAGYLSGNASFCQWAYPRHTSDDGVANGVVSRVTVTNRIVTRVTVAGLLAVWSAANEYSKGGFLPTITADELDDIAGIPSFGEAMKYVGWAVDSEDPPGVTLPNFCQHNTLMEERSSAAKRQRLCRERKKAPRESAGAPSQMSRELSRDVTVQRREEKSIDIPLCINTKGGTKRLEPPVGVSPPGVQRVEKSTKLTDPRVAQFFAEWPALFAKHQSRPYVDATPAKDRAVARRLLAAIDRSRPGEDSLGLLIESARRLLTTPPKRCSGVPSVGTLSGFLNELLPTRKMPATSNGAAK